MHRYYLPDAPLPILDQGALKFPLKGNENRAAKNIANKIADAHKLLDPDSPLPYGIDGNPTNKIKYIKACVELDIQPTTNAFLHLPLMMNVSLNRMPLIMKRIKRILGSHIANKLNATSTK